MASTKRKSGTEGVPVTKKVKLDKKVDTNARSPREAPLKSKPVPKDGIAAKSKTKRPVAAPAGDFAGFDDAEDHVPKTATAAAVESGLLAGFDSSSEESDGEERPAIKQIPSIPKSALVQAQDAAANAPDPERTPGTIYIGRIPHGFYEPQLKSYLTQFGTIKRLRLSRNKKTGKAKHYGFVEFESAAVADIVCKTMDKYLLFGHILQVRRIPDDQVHAELWKGANKRFKAMPRGKLEGGMLARGKGRQAWEKTIDIEEKRRRAKAKKLQAMGYDFEIPEIRKVDSVPKRVEPAEDIVVGEIEGGEVDKVDKVAPAKATEQKAATEGSVVEEIEPPEGTAAKRKKEQKEKKITKKARVSV